MKLVIREYLASLRERGELDAILPDLLSQLGMTVFSRPGRGTRQDGVDVGAVGRLEGGQETVYLFLIKAGDLTRQDWSAGPQSLRSSLEEVLELYLRNRLPEEHRDKAVVVCVCLGGDVLEPVRPQLRSFFEKYTDERVSFEEWNGDRLAGLIQQCFLREELLPDGARSSFRKSVALLDEPSSSFAHFAALVRSLVETQGESDDGKLMSMRQMNLCLRILFAWCRKAGNTESAFLAAELTLLHGWQIFKEFADGRTRTAKAATITFTSIFDAYEEISADFIRTYVVPHAGKLHGLSAAVRGASRLDVNLKLFDLLGRVGVTGLWLYWTASQTSPEQVEERTHLLTQATGLGDVVKAMIDNNPTLMLPATDDQTIDVGIVCYFLALTGNSAEYARGWIREIAHRASFALQSHGYYPTTFSEYGDLLVHPKRGDDEYLREATAGSILYPLLAVWAALLDEREVYQTIATLKQEVIAHCTFQYWYPDEYTEGQLYAGGRSHGATLTDVGVERPMPDLLKQVFSECDAARHFEELSAVARGWWPLVVVACRHRRLPLPLHFLIPLRDAQGAELASGKLAGEEGAAEEGE